MPCWPPKQNKHSLCPALHTVLGLNRVAKLKNHFKTLFKHLKGAEIKCFNLKSTTSTRLMNKNNHFFLYTYYFLFDFT